MNASEKIKQLINSHLELLNLAKETLEDIGGCDHQVGICCCGLIKIIEEGEEIQNRFNPKKTLLQKRR
jgi:hypothetical protein